MCGSVIEGLLITLDKLNLRDPLAKIYFIQLCKVLQGDNAVGAIISFLDDSSFRVVLAVVMALTEMRSWDELCAHKGLPLVSLMANQVVSAFQAPRPLLHFSALRASAALGKSWVVGGANGNPFSQLKPLVNVQVQNDSVFHRWQAITAMIWLSANTGTLCIFPFNLLAHVCRFL